MKISPLLVQILLAISATAIPLADKQQHADAASLVPPAVNNTLVTRDGEDDDYGWSGAGYEYMPFESKFTGIGARFKVPEVTFPAENQYDYKASLDITIGIDGRTYTDAMLLAGIHCQSPWKGEREYHAFWEWWRTTYTPDVYELRVGPGDEVQISIKTTSPTAATIVFENLSTGQEVTVNAAPDDPSRSALRGADAHWTVSNAVNPFYGVIPPPNFGNVKFTHTWAEIEAGALVDSGSATLINTLMYEGQLVATPKKISNTEVEIAYHGPK
ncbi:hypothetical protein VTN31DRAFT_4711 [Thermomyces dupontii]|uniref:uncharacterized protein n=1 Tax=Talaromyces thermophilus TaxID=28565 RepID=UPI003743B00D